MRRDRHRRRQRGRHELSIPDGARGPRHGVPGRNHAMTIIRGRAPLRLGLAGGGTDVSPYCDEFGGRILNATIDKYAYAYVEQIPEGVEFTSPDRECSGRAEIYDVDALLDDFSLHVAVY